jgi:hypothetical protein
VRFIIKKSCRQKKYRFSGKAGFLTKLDIYILCSFVVNITHNATLKYAMTWKTA